MSDSIPSGPTKSEAKWFATTRWTAVLNARDQVSPGSTQALELLCSTYWYPLYAFVRSKGYTSHEAEDLTQGFFARFLEKRYLDAVAPAKGKFRTFLLCSLDHFLANEWDKSQRLKRGGGLTWIPLETAHAEERYEQEIADANPPENLYDRTWADTMLRVVLARLRTEFESSGKVRRFEDLKKFLLGEPEAESYAKLADRLTLSEQGVKSAVHRLRQRFRELFREEIAHTVGTRAEIDEELRYLVRLMTS